MRKQLVLIGLALMVFIAVVDEVSAQTVYSCQNNKTGAIRFVLPSVKCKSTETQIIWHPAGTLKVYDARNQYIGILINRMPGMTSVFIPSMSLFFEFTNHEDDNGTYCTNDEYLQFTESDCSGIPYLIHTLQHQIVSIEGNTTDHLWAGDINAVPVRKSILAYGRYINGGWKCYPEANPSQVFVIPAYEVTSLPFTLPFTLPPSSNLLSMQGKDP